ncbi:MULTISPECIES: helix-turn-helix transcriptional regulator [unclassified Streptomyces]|uniref:helix-turn-helix domain-containing protein n=1 Tax=unclassified Streptomyces TaxID=2593676 RepID=UPI001F3B7859|nr:MULTISPECIES: helix-turn-helix transcriptional regulator [unclassified Streptomyces]
MAELLGKKVRHRREQRGWTQEALGAKVHVSHNRIAQIERGTDPPPGQLAELLDVVLDYHGEIVELWKLLANEGFKDYAKTFLKRQAVARSIHEFSLTVPGLLQTAAFARSIMEYGAYREDLGDAVRRRMERQHVLDSEDPPWLWVILEESVLFRSTGSRVVMREQLEHLLEYGERPNIHLQVLRKDRPCVPGSISLLTMHDGSRGAYTEGFKTGQFFEDPKDVEQYQKIYDRLHADALGTGPSAGLIQAALRKHT